MPSKATAWYHSLSEEEKKEHNRQRYQKHKARYNTQSKKWAKQNPLKAQVSSHTTTVRKKYPAAFVEKSPSAQELKNWIQEQGDRPVCVFCAARATSIDHVIPLSRGGLHVLSNLRLLCNDCNRAKHAKTDKEFIEWLERLVNNKGTFLSNQLSNAELQGE